MVFNMRLWQVSLAGDSERLIWHLLVTFGGTPNFNVADSLDGAYLGPFTVQELHPFVHAHVLKRRMGLNPTRVI